MNLFSPASAIKRHWVRGTTMSPKQRERWAKVRSGGERRFVWLRGVCGWGIYMFCVSRGVPAIRDYSRRHALDHLFWSQLIIGAVIWPIGGYFFGTSLWASTERRFLGPQASPPTPPNHALQRTAKGGDVPPEFNY